MKLDLQIISKGLYKGDVDKAFPIEVKEYVFARKEGRKCLMLRFLNQSRLNVTGLNFWLIQKNFYGEQISKEKISLDNIESGTDKVFAPPFGFSVQDKCVDFEVQMISAFSGEYEYISENGECLVRYQLKEEKREIPKLSKNAERCVQYNKLDKKVKFATVILILAIFLIALAIIWPFFEKQVIPLINQGLQNAKEFLGDKTEAFFEHIGNLFKKETPNVIGEVYGET